MGAGCKGANGPMYLELAQSDIIIFAIAAACLVGVVVLEMIRFVLPEVYAWIADHEKVKREIREGRVLLEKLQQENKEQAGLRDRRNAERFRLKSQMSRVEMMLVAAEKARAEVWHELGQQMIGDTLFVAKLANRRLADMVQRDFDSAPVVWRYDNAVRIWASTEQRARQMLAAEFPVRDGYSILEFAASTGNRDTVKS